MSSINFRHMTSIYLREDEKFLLLYRVGSRVIAPSWTGTAGGHMEKDELYDPQACVLRELYEETGLCADDIQNLALRYVTLRYKNDEIRQNHYFFADLKPTNRVISSSEGILKWFAPQDLHSLPMPHSARYVIDHFLTTGRLENALYGGISVDDGCVFTELKDF